MSRLTHTPHYDAWLARLRILLEPAGAKTDLATHMAGQRGQELPTWRVNISRILRTGNPINAEDLLIISAWMDSRRTQTTPRKTRTVPAKRNYT